MKIESHIPGRIRLKFDSVLELRQFRSLLSKIEGINEIKEKSASILITYSPNTEAEFLFKNLKSSQERIKLDKDDLYHYTAPFIKHPATKALYSMMLLGFKRGLITFGICSIFLTRYLKSKF
ncbi:MAG: hypothetical protein WHT47_03975 [Hydrogenothermaceae bacterium]